ncbi:MAG: hypothetical protein HYU52_02845 [Acidobacteria bacterium]|nr:hypothetical protein [Acidobacteriota bacterium]
MREISILSDSPRPEKRWSIWSRIVLLLGFWLFIGFAVGTVFLLFPVRWWATLCRDNAWTPATERSGVVLIILLLVLVSFAIANGAMTAFVRSHRVITRLLLVVVTLGAAGTAYWKWINPSTMKGSMAAEQKAGAHFTFGPFPDAGRLASLKGEGYTGVISLLHPAVVPFEPQLIAQEKREAVAAGIELIHLPMLPWVSDNTESMDKLRAIAKAKKGRYYIHCYLGADRVNVARRIIEQETGGLAVIEGAGASTRRSLDEQKKLERGPIFKLEEGLYLIPYPTDEEFLGFVLAGQVKNVVALLDPRDESQKRRIDHERALLAQYSLPFHLVEIGEERYGGRRIVEALQKAKRLEKPTVIHAFFTPGKFKSPIAEAVLIAHRTGLPPLPPSMWKATFAGGKPQLLAPHVAIGPRPTESEFYESIHARGIRTALFVGDASAMPSSDATAASQAGVELRAIAADPAVVLDTLQEGGPYYLYGPGSAAVKEPVRARYAEMMTPIEPVGGKPAETP